ncbi:hypothetical protein AMATHDRAFT_73230 [Amanita thiersii Skay4041]|uniref:Threonine aspartase n=1 Tax=Amanita thiersii Skay4041 TaxID=703135 RepID=A0A2A9NUN8_9AGAR|nr:hypothetical protein AMATHDRAFT_73230 [Amanita thiersii Skay4041]
MYIAVHAGAGMHSRTSEKRTKHALQQACLCALSSLSSSTTALSIVESAISSLEDDPYLNAGYGSNLTLDGRVECDAAIMDGATGDFGSVGAVSGVKNPIKIARMVLEHSRVPDKLGRLRPMMLVSNGARDFVTTTTSSAGTKVELVPPESLITPQASNEWKMWKDRLISASESVSIGQMDGLDNIQDTVGAVAWSEGVGAAAGVSSGGLLLKDSGRVGEAAIYGAGCWAQRSMCCSVSGAGEYIIRAMLARSIGEELMKHVDADPHDILYRILVEKFWDPCRSRGEPYPNAGVVLLTSNEDTNLVRLWCAFTTPSMAIAYASLRDPVPKAIILRRPYNLEKQPSHKPRIYITAFSL